VYFVLLKYLITLARTLISSLVERRRWEDGQKVAKKCKLGWQVKVSRNLVNYRLKLSGPLWLHAAQLLVDGFFWGTGERGLLNYVHITSL